MSVTNESIMKSMADGSWKPNLYLTNLSIAQFQSNDAYVAKKLFPLVPVRMPSGKFYTFDKASLARINMIEKPAFGKVAPTVFAQDELDYSTKVYQQIIGIDQISALPYARAGAPGVADPKVAKTKVLTEQINIFMDYMFAQSYFKTGVWTNEKTGVSSSPSTNQFLQFDKSGSDPIQVIDDLMTEITMISRRKPNKLAMGVNVYKALKHNTALLDRVRYGGSTANPATVTKQVMAQLFDVEEVLVLESTYNKAAFGATADMDYICDPDGMLLCYATSSPSIDEPSAGYTFTWDMLGTGAYMSIANYLGEPGTHSEFIEGLCSFVMKQVCQDTAVYLKDCVS